MYSTQKDAKESKFTVVTAKRRSGLQDSALFFHLLNDNSAIQDALSTNTIVDIKRPKSTFPHTWSVQTPEYILLRLNNNLLDNTQDLFAHLARITGYTGHSAEDLHIRIDREYGLKNTKLAKEDSLWHSHITLRYTADADINIVVHIYIDNNVVQKICVAEQGKPTRAVTGDLFAQVYSLAVEPLKIIRTAIEHMLATKDQLQLELEKKLETLTTPGVMAASTEATINEALVEAKKLEDEVIRYSEGVFPARVETIKRYIYTWRERQQADAAEAAEQAQELSNLRLTDEEESLSMAGTSWSSSSTRMTPSPYAPFSPNPSPVSFSPTLDFQQKSPRPMVGKTIKRSKAQVISSIKDANAQYKKLDETIKKIKLSPNDAYGCYLGIEKLLYDVLLIECDVIDFNMRNESVVALKQLIENLSIKPIFLHYLKTYNVEGVTKLYPLLRNKLDMDFYTDFLFDITQTIVVKTHDSKIIEICELFFKYDQNYRKCLYRLDYTHVVMASRVAGKISMSMLLYPILVDRFELFTCLLQQSNARNFIGFTESETTNTRQFVHQASLLTAACVCGYSNFIHALLDVNPDVETAYPFVSADKPMAHRFIGTPADTSSSSVANDAKFDEIVDVLKQMLSGKAALGSALSVYVRSEQIEQEVLARLAKATNPLHLIIGFAYFSEHYADNSLVYSTDKDVFRHDSSAERRFVFSRSEIQKASPRKISYVGAIYGGNKPADDVLLKTFMPIVKDRISKLNQAELLEIINQLQASSDEYNRLGHLFEAVICLQAILIAGMFLPSTSANHTIISETFLNRGDLCLKLHSANDPKEAQRQLAANYRIACEIAMHSKYSVDLIPILESERVNKVFNFSRPPATFKPVVI